MTTIQQHGAINSAQPRLTPLAAEPKHGFIAALKKIINSALVMIHAKSKCAPPPLVPDNYGQRRVTMSNVRWLDSPSLHSDNRPTAGIGQRYMPQAPTTTGQHDRRQHGLFSDVAKQQGRAAAHVYSNAASRRTHVQELQQPRPAIKSVERRQSPPRAQGVPPAELTKLTLEAASEAKQQYIQLRHEARQRADRGELFGVNPPSHERLMQTILTSKIDHYQRAHRYDGLAPAEKDLRQQADALYRDGQQQAQRNADQGNLYGVQAPSYQQILDQLRTGKQR